MADSTSELPEVSLFFRFYGNSFNPVEITRRLGIEPNKSWKSGEQMGSVQENRQHRHDAWMVKVGPQRTVDINELLRDLRTRVNTDGNLIKELCADLNVEAVIVCGVIQTSQGRSAAIEFPVDFLEWAASKNASIVVDVIDGP